MYAEVPTAPGPRHAVRQRRGVRWPAAAASVVVAAAGAIVPAFTNDARADAPWNLVVDSAAWGGADTNPGDGVCRNAAGTCTLRAAVEESNALHGQPGQVTITVDPSIGAGTSMQGTVDVFGDTMLRAQITAADQGAYFAVTSPVTIDLGHRLLVDGTANGALQVAAFYLDGPDIALLNADQVLSAGTSFVVGPHAERVTIDGDTGGGTGLVDPWNQVPKRFVVFREGAADVTVKNYRITGYWDPGNDGGIFVFNPYSTEAMRNIAVDRVEVLYPPVGTPRSYGATCRTRITNFWKGTVVGTSWSMTHVDGLSFRNMRVENLDIQFAFQLRDNHAPTDPLFAGSAHIKDLVIEDSVFLQNKGHSSSENTAFITLPYDTLTGTTSIQRNVFTRHRYGLQTHAIGLYGTAASGSTVASGVTIADNYFDGYGTPYGSPLTSVQAATITTRRAGLVTVSGNTFGPATGSKTTTDDEEHADGPVLMYDSIASFPFYASNRSIHTWVPGDKANVLVGPPPAGAWVAASPSTGPVCQASVAVGQTRFLGPLMQQPAGPLTIQVYWTTKRFAEVYLGEVSGVTGTGGTLVFALPTGPVTLPDGQVVQIVDLAGEVSGNIRLQTHEEHGTALASSQYSRVAEVLGTCQPTLTINQAAGMDDPTMARDLHFTLASSVSLDPASLTADDIVLTATPVPQTIDSSRLAPRVVSITQVGTTATVFDVLVRVDDSARVSVAVGAHAVLTGTGKTNLEAATSTDDTITYLNPLRVEPPDLLVVRGDPNARAFTVEVDQAAPVPTADLTFTATADHSGDLTLSTSTFVVAAGSLRSPPVTVTAVGIDVTRYVAMVVESADTNYDGVVVPQVTVRLYGADPRVQVTKQAYTDVTDTSSPARVQATGKHVPSGSRLVVGQAVCFVYTVTNTSDTDEATTLTDLVVTDSDTRLGADGTIATVAALGPGRTAQLFACTTLVAVDTTAGAAP
ncbi:MAG: hypothetical protein FWF02_11275 [Micrococcales bacterium]|nr:hypothetical protein [Micrococcales bacterium]MCL2668269.1 hypothetical protein [Micrococcales bacterium]